MHLATSNPLHENPLPISHFERMHSRAITGSNVIVLSNIILRIAVYSVVLFSASTSVAAEDRFSQALQENSNSFLPSIYPVPESPLSEPTQLTAPRTLSKQSRKITLPGRSTKPQTSQTGSVWRTTGALLVVLAIFLFGAKLWRKHIPVANIGLPTEAIEILGRKSIESRHSVYLIRCGTRILVVGSSVDGMQTLAEVTDPVEVDHLAGICRRADQQNGFAQTFQTWFNNRSSHHPTPEEALRPFEVDSDVNEKTIGQLNIQPSPEQIHKSETVHA